MNENNKVDASLQSAVADAYRVFKRYRAPKHPLNACLACCLSEQTEKEMRTLPLAKLTARHFYEYNTAAKGPEQPADEVKYLLPRMLELLADGQDIHHSLEISLRRVESCEAGSFSDTETAVLNRFALAYFRQMLTGAGPHGDQRLLDDTISVLLMFHIAGLNIEPLLALWLQLDEPASTVQFVQDTYWEFWKDHDISNAFATDYPAFKALLKRWLLDPAVRHRFVGKLMAPDFLRRAATEQGYPSVSFNVMVDAVFDELTR
ncbi:hypothetical protein [Roseateles terrae]|uniref:Uncharacterized protein n=1 Tax=Roseateles terrae TaxID=431060 RepID=A0ABR6GXN2_9BURK|nr:hypothetical protein [Roseateles terrae]MBB3196863.1 hypothetical protein [Roseateles terrae]